MVANGNYRLFVAVHPSNPANLAGERFCPEVESTVCCLRFRSEFLQ